MRPLLQSDFNTLLDRLDIPDAMLALLLGVASTSIRNWRKGSHQVPDGVMIEMAELVRVLDGWFLWMESRRK